MLSVFFSSKCSIFHNSNVFGSRINHILYTGCAKIKKKINSGTKRLILLPFWQISALDLESINVKFYFTSRVCLIFFSVVVVSLLLMIFVMVGLAFLTFVRA